MSDADSSSGRRPRPEPGDAGSAAEVEFEEALVAYGKKSQDFQVHLVELCDLSEALAVVMAAHRRAVEAARAQTWREAARLLRQHLACIEGKEPPEECIRDEAEEFERRAGEKK